jgi:predicted HicB family RNase H-like nuclease
MQEIERLAAPYPKIVEWSEEDDCYVGRCPMLFGGGVHGTNEARVYRELCRIAEEWVELLHQDGSPLPPTRRSADYSGRFMVRVDPALHQRLALKAAASGRSLNSLVAKALARA